MTLLRTIDIQEVSAASLREATGASRIGCRSTRRIRSADPSELRELFACQLSNVEIRRELCIGDATVKTHVPHRLQNLDLRDLVQAVVFADQCGFASENAPSAADRDIDSRR